MLNTMNQVLLQLQLPDKQSLRKRRCDRILTHYAPHWLINSSPDNFLIINHICSIILLKF